MKKVISVCFLACFVFLSFTIIKEKPVLYIIGDSTVKNGNGNGGDSLWGWGSLINVFFDSTQLSIENRAIGGRSSRTFITEGRWASILQHLKKGDYVIMQFGHNDASPLDDTARARGTIRGIGKESNTIYNPIRKMKETVYTYGYYMRIYIRDVQKKGAIPIICSPVPRNNFINGKTKRGDKDYGLWAKQIAAETGAYFIDLNKRVADSYDLMGADSVNKFFPKDHTHPNKEGSLLNAQKVVDGIKDLRNCSLKKYLQKL